MSTRKICSKCLKEKNIFEFNKLVSASDGCYPTCKTCLREYRQKNKEKIAQYSRKAYLTHQEERKAIQRLYTINHRQKIKKASRKYYLKNRDHICKRNYQYKQQRLASDPLFKLLNNLRRRVSIAITDGAAYKANKTMELIGCTPKQLKEHLEKQFLLGMSWSNYGYEGWHVDHIIPCAAFNLSDLEQQRKCFHYTNLQPLWASENYTKADKVGFTLYHSPNS